MRLFVYIFISLFLVAGCEQKPKKQVEKSCVIDPSIEYYRKGMLQLKNGNTSEAIKYFEKQILAKKDDVLSYSVLANIYMQSKEYEKAKSILESASKLKPKNADIYFSLSQCYIHFEDYKRAFEAIKISVEIYKENNNRTNYLQAVKIHDILKDKISK